MKFSCGLGHILVIGLFNVISQVIDWDLEEVRTTKVPFDIAKRISISPEGVLSSS